MKLTFNRSQTIEVKIQRPDAVRAFVFDLELAVAKPTEPQIDPMSGMLLNLVEVDAVIAELRAGLKPATSVKEVLENCSVFLTSRLKSKGCELNELTLREKRGYWCSWKASALTMGNEATREWAGGVWRFSSEHSFDETLLEKQPLHLAATPAEVFQTNSTLLSYTAENLGSSEKWSYKR